MLAEEPAGRSASGERVLVGCSQLDECFVRSALLVGVSLVREQPIRRLDLRSRRRSRDAEDTVWIGARHITDGGEPFLIAAHGQARIRLERHREKAVLIRDHDGDRNGHGRHARNVTRLAARVFHHDRSRHARLVGHEAHYTIAIRFVALQLDRQRVIKQFETRAAFDL